MSRQSLPKQTGKTLLILLLSSLSLLKSKKMNRKALISALMLNMICQRIRKQES